MLLATAANEPVALCPRKMERERAPRSTPVSTSSVDFSVGLRDTDVETFLLLYLVGIERSK